jgi:glycosyltransferase involved in cell wall biosynthesis
VTSADHSFATTRGMTTVRPSTAEPWIPGLPRGLFLPANPDRIAEGGLRRQGYFKRSCRERPLITVITVVRNQAADVASTIESVLCQSYDAVEYIVIDGGSTDGTVDQIRRFDGAIDYWASEPDKGISEAFNKGLSVATGEWVNFLNAGDTLAFPEALAHLVGHLDTHADIVYGKANMVDGNGHVLCALGSAFDPARFRRRMTFRHQAAFHNVEYFRKYGAFDTRLAVAMDYELLRRKPELSARFVDSVLAQIVTGGISERWDFRRCRECRNVDLSYVSGLQVLPVYLGYLGSVFRCCVRRVLQRLGLHRCVSWYRVRKCGLS